MTLEAAPPSDEPAPVLSGWTLPEDGADEEEEDDDADDSDWNVVNALLPPPPSQPEAVEQWASAVGYGRPRARSRRPQVLRTDRLMALFNRAG
jgi:hypothetical protein